MSKTLVYAQEVSRATNLSKSEPFDKAMSEAVLTHPIEFAAVKFWQKMLGSTFYKLLVSKRANGIVSNLSTSLFPDDEILQELWTDGGLNEFVTISLRYCINAMAITHTSNNGTVKITPDGTTQPSTGEFNRQQNVLMTLIEAKFSDIKDWICERNTEPLFEGFISLYCNESKCTPTTSIHPRTFLSN